jgi:hypothetical protein
MILQRLELDVRHVDPFTEHKSVVVHLIASFVMILIALTARDPRVTAFLRSVRPF